MRLIDGIKQKGAQNQGRKDKRSYGFSNGHDCKQAGASEENEKLCFTTIIRALSVTPDCGNCRCLPALGQTLLRGGINVTAAVSLVADASPFCDNTTAMLDGYLTLDSN